MIPRAKSAARDRILPLAARVARGQRPAGARRVLIVQPDHLGDILLSQPAVMLLREALPDDEITAVVGPWSRAVTELAWPVDRVVEVEFPGFTRASARSPIAPYRQLRRDSDRLIGLASRAAIVLRPDAWWATWLSSLVSPVVIASDDPRCAPFATHTIPIPAGAHAVTRALTIASGFIDGSRGDLSCQASYPLTFKIQHTASARAAELLRCRGITDPYIVIHPGSGAPVKEWTPQRWADVTLAATARGFQVVLTGTLAEQSLTIDIRASAAVAVSLAGQTSVAELAAILRGATLVIGPDSGPLHLAVATGTPSIHLFGPSDPIRYGPWGDPNRHRVVRAGWNCPRCGDLSLTRQAACGCMLALRTSDVISTLDELLADIDAT